MKADEPDTDILETLRKLVKRVEILEIDNRQLKKENEQLRQENTQLRQENTRLRQENTRLKKRIEELERKNKRYVAPHSRELAKEDPKPSGRRAGADRPPWGAALSKTRELSATNKALKMKTSRLLSQWISPIFAPNARPSYCSSPTRWTKHSSLNSPKLNRISPNTTYPWSLVLTVGRKLGWNTLTSV